MNGRTVWKKNDTAVVRIEDIGRDGQGIGHAEGYTLFVKNTVPGDLAVVRIVKAGKKYGYGRLMEIKEPSSFRVEEACPVAGKCGGCQLQMLEYAEQLRWKEKKVREDLERIGGFGNLLQEPIAGMEKTFRYRNKAQFPVGRDKNGEITAGFYAGRTHAIIPCEDCLLGPEENSVLLKAVLTWMKTAHVEPYDETAGSGLVRHVLIRKGFRSGEFHVCLVINARKLPDSDLLIRTLRAAEPQHLTGISFSCNTSRGNTIMGNRSQVLWGAPWLTDALCSERFGLSVTYRISPDSFYQVNPVQTEKLYEKVLEYADLHGTETVADLYCGIGTISLFLARNAGKVIGVEIIPEAVSDAKENAVLNGIDNAEFYAGKAEEIIPRLYEQGLTADVIVVDPPRKGCDQKLLETIARMKPERLVYVSCDPATLARDLQWLGMHGFQIEKLQPFDQFPMTVHVESVVKLTRAGL